MEDVYVHVEGFRSVLLGLGTVSLIVHDRQQHPQVEQGDDHEAHQNCGRKKRFKSRTFHPVWGDQLLSPAPSWTGDEPIIHCNSALITLRVSSCHGRGVNPHCKRRGRRINHKLITPPPSFVSLIECGISIL